MHRRRLLATSSALLAGGLAGCLGDDPASDQDDSTDDGSAATDGEAASDGDDPASAEAVDPPASVEPDPAACSPASRPLSERFVDDPGEHCYEGASPSFVVENERDESVEVVVELAGADTVERAYSLDAGDRAIERSPVSLDGPFSATVTVDGESRAVEWAERSCLRHGVALTGDGIETGWIEPTVGPGDTQHDCYAGGETSARVWNLGEAARTVEVTFVDLCAGTSVSEELSFEGRSRRETDATVVRGRDYDVYVDGEDVEPTRVAFHDECWRPYVEVEADGSVSVRTVGTF